MTLGTVMLLALRDYTKISTTRMDGPQTRTEKKGRDKKGGKGVIYSAKHVRLTAALAAGAGARVEPARVPSNAGSKAPRKKT